MGHQTMEEEYLTQQIICWKKKNMIKKKKTEGGHDGRKDLHRN